jgi:hypothetical protein
MARIDPEIRRRASVSGDGEDAELRARRWEGTQARAFSGRDDLDGRTTGELLSDLTSEFTRLMRGELGLAKAELKHEVEKASRSGGAIAGGGVLAHTGWLAVAAGLIALLALAIPLWASALIVGVVLIGAGALLAKKMGVDGFKQVHGPERTIKTLQEDKQWANETWRNAKSNVREPV